MRVSVAIGSTRLSVNLFRPSRLVCHYLLFAAGAYLQSKVFHQPSQPERRTLLGRRRTAWIVSLKLCTVTISFTIALSSISVSPLLPKS
jgi:hypothetical protein